MESHGEVHGLLLAVEVKSHLCRPGEQEQGVGRRSLFGRSDVGSGGGEGQPAAEYPLYCESNRDRPKFAGKVA
jgi:hypothetical protein